MMSIATLSCHFEPKLFKARSIIFAHSLPYLPSRRLSYRTTIRTHAEYKIQLVEPDGKSHEFFARDDTSILEAAENKGVHVLKATCRTGECSTCTGKLESGKVDQSKGKFLNGSQKKQKYILTCISYPRSNCVIHTDKEGELYK